MTKIVLLPLAFAVTTAAGTAGVVAVSAPEPAQQPVSEAFVLNERYTVNGTVVDTEGAPAAEVPVRLMALTRAGIPGGGLGKGGTKKRSTDGTPGDPTELFGDAEPLMLQGAMVKTDANGKFKFENIPEGAYTLEAGLRKHPTMGFVTKPVFLRNGKDKTDMTVKLKPAKKNKGGSGGRDPRR